MGQRTWVVIGLALVMGGGCGPRRQMPRERPSMQGSVESPPASAPADEPAAPPATGPAAIAEPEPPATRPATTAPAAPATTRASTTGPATTPATAPATTQSSATRPATTQAAMPVESPRQVLAGVMNSTFRGDAEGVRRRLHVAGDESRRLADAMADVASAAAKVRAAAAARFGPEEAKKLDVDVVPPVVIASAEERIEGDRAFVKLQGQNGNGIAFQKIDGGWKMSLPELIDSQRQGRSIDQLVHDTRSPVGRFEDLARRVSEGQFQSAEQLLAELAQTFFSSQQR